ncbi:WcbI family polysaccharide biosynthesis putative acetyltransferase [Methylobacterium nigriterrae]|uniref:WcbI family polysaccharide biosynthesis putative acetyltransferase n=1 Tax=Methylobacterium nigriterrae TaxID=3127512 RepID=UPI003013F230
MVPTLALRSLPRRALSALTLSAPSWATPWRKPGAEESGRTGPRIAVIGNCQARGVAQAMRLLAPTSPVRFIQMAWLKREHGHIDNLARTLAGFDHVYSQQFPGGLIPGGDVTALKALEPRLRLFPTIVFPAFHPDMVYAGAISDLAALKLAPSPMGQYHSAIALAAHRAGLTPAQAVALYREDVFARLGYLDLWESSVRDMLASAAQTGFGLEREMTRWARRGNFMYVLNHPRAFVIGDIARRLLEESGLRPEPVEIEDYIGDELARDVVWPLYPPVAEAYGLTGAYLFKAKPRGKAFPRLYDLPGFVAASFAIYDRLTPQDIASQRVDSWLADPEIAGIFAPAGTG